MASSIQEAQQQKRIAEHERSINALTHELNVQKYLNRIMIGALVRAMDEISPKRNVYEVITQTIEGFKPMVSGKDKAAEEAIAEALKMLQKP